MVNAHRDTRPQSILYSALIEEKAVHAGIRRTQYSKLGLFARVADGNLSINEVRENGSTILDRDLVDFGGMSQDRYKSVHWGRWWVRKGSLRHVFK